MRRSVLPVTLSLALLAGSGALANDQIYKCVDPNGNTMLSDKPCAVVESVPADTAPAANVAAVPEYVATLPAVEAPRRVVVKEHYTLPPQEIDHGQWAKKPPVSTPPKVDVATLKAAKLKLELEDKTASVRQASLD
ncbi:uncharacterized protein DUF4124 [Pseudoduganella flava]|uniref:DUF4124 domain-containing protein n=1 Tax=Pseudoduganella flava TaxID=871742 RepID=A0A562Q483_9BURK|nr:DUF4124 domain-containing protein [Pseudoduganella flava]QGZ41564.1 DUF4124 domain-containing protein [Pseudoduganella flava]TWI51542.1 uncharacterized protein DUF4124 [Pseudoduganella flava]